MNSNMMLLMVLAMSSSSSGRSSGSELFETMLYSSNMLPETMRLMFAMMSAQKRNSRTDTLAKEVASAMDILVDGAAGVKLTTAQLDARPELKALLDRVSSTERGEVVGTASVLADPTAPATRTAARSKPAAK
jgi:hypothetical protein